MASTRQKILEYLAEAERVAPRTGELASGIASAIDAAIPTTSAELRRMRSAGLVKTFGETTENNRKAVLWALGTVPGGETPNHAPEAVHGELVAVPGASVPSGEASKAESTEPLAAALAERARERVGLIKHEETEHTIHAVLPDVRLSLNEALDEAVAKRNLGKWPLGLGATLDNGARLDWFPHFISKEDQTPPTGPIVDETPALLERIADLRGKVAARDYAKGGVVSTDTPIADAVKAELGTDPETGTAAMFMVERRYAVDDVVDVFDQPYRLGDPLVPLGRGRVTATPAEDASLAEGEYRVKLPGVDVIEQGPNGDVFDTTELRPAEAGVSA